MIRSVLLAALLLLLPGIARADTSDVELVWDGDAGCPSHEAVRASIAALLGPGQQVHVAVRAARKPDGTWTGTVGTSGRTIVGRSCAEVADALAVVVAIAAMPAASAPADAPALPSEARPGPSSEPALPPAADVVAPLPVDADRRIAPSRPDTTRGDLVVAGEAVVIAGALGKAAPAAGVLLAWRRGALRLEVGATYVPPVTVERTDLLASGTFELALAAAGACWMPSLGRWSAGVCTHVDGGRISARGSGVGVAPLREARPWVAARAGAVAAWRIAAPLALRAEVAAVVPVTRDDFVIANVGTVEATPAVALRTGLGVEMHFR